MSLDLIKKNSNSPFHLQRSIVSQEGEGGAYESGGYNPDAVYNNDAANATIMSFGKIVGAGLEASGKDKEKEITTKKLNPKTVEAKATKAFGVKKSSELLDDYRTFNKQHDKEDAMVFNKYTLSNNITKI